MKRRNKRKRTTRKSLAQVLARSLAMGTAVAVIVCLIGYWGLALYIRGQEHSLAAQMALEVTGLAGELEKSGDKGLTYDTIAVELLRYAALEDGITGSFGAAILDPDTGEVLGDSFRTYVRFVSDGTGPDYALACENDQPDMAKLLRAREKAERLLDPYYVSQGTAWADIKFTKIWADKEHRTFLPAEAAITGMTYHYGTQVEMTWDTFTFDQKDTSGMELMEGNMFTLSWTKFTDPEFEQVMHFFYPDAFSYGTQDLSWGNHGAFARTYYLEFQAEFLGRDCGVRVGLDYQGWTAFWKRWFTLGCAGACVIMLTLSLIAGLLRYTKLKARWDMEEYRRRTTDTLAHDLKTPLTAMIGYAENLRDSRDYEIQEKYIGGIISNASYCNEIITSFLDLSRAEQLRPNRRERLELGELARSLAGKYAPELEDREVTFEVSGSAQVFCDPESMSRALENLISNAVRRTPRGGSITVTADRHSLTLTNTVDGPVPDIDRLTEPFFKPDTARTGRGGSGLGLAIADELLRAQGFRLELGCTETQFTALVRK